MNTSRYVWIPSVTATPSRMKNACFTSPPINAIMITQKTIMMPIAIASFLVLSSISIPTPRKRSIVDFPAGLFHTSTRSGNDAHRRCWSYLTPSG